MAEYHALRAWRDELRRGLRTSTTFDALWRAASAEMLAIDHKQIPELHDRFLEEARSILEKEILKRGVDL